MNDSTAKFPIKDDDHVMSLFCRHVLFQYLSNYDDFLQWVAFLDNFCFESFYRVLRGVIHGYCRKLPRSLSMINSHSRRKKFGL